MSTNKPTEKTAPTIDQVFDMLQKMESAQNEVLNGQEKTALTMAAMEQRISKMETQQQTTEGQDRLQKALDANKPGIAQKFRHASTGKKAAIITLATAATAGVAYGSVKGYEYYRDRKAAGQPLLQVNEAPSVSPTKNDAIRQSLGK